MPVLGFKLQLLNTDILSEILKLVRLLGSDIASIRQVSLINYYYIIIGLMQMLSRVLHDFNHCGSETNLTPATGALLASAEVDEKC